MPGQDRAERLYELAQHQFEYERYDMAAAYAGRALQSVSDVELGERLRDLLHAAQAAEARLARGQTRGPRHQPSEARRKRRRDEPAAESPARPMLDTDGDTDADGLVSDAFAPPRPATQRPSILTPPVPERPPPAAAVASPRAGSCMHCGHPLPDRSITLCPGCGQDPLLDAAADEDAESGNTRPLQGGMAVPTTPPRVLCCPQCGGALPQPLPGFCQNCGARTVAEETEPRLPAAPAYRSGAPGTAGPRLLVAWTCVAVSVALIVGYTALTRAADGRLQRIYPPSTRGANAPQLSPPPAQHAGGRSYTAGQTGAGVGRMPERPTRPDQQIHTRTRVGWWKGDSSWRTPTFRTGELWAICWVTAEAGTPFGTVDVSIHSADGGYWRPAVFALGTDQGIEYCYVAGTFYLEIDANEPWEIEVWDLN